MLDGSPRGLDAVVDTGRQPGWDSEESLQLVAVRTVIGVTGRDDGDGV